MKRMFARLGAFLHARLNEPSTHAGIAAFLVVVAAGAETVGSSKAAIGLLVAAAASGIKAAVTADPTLAPELGAAEALGRVALPVAVDAVEAALPEHAARIAALEAQVEALVSTAAPAAAAQ